MSSSPAAEPRSSLTGLHARSMLREDPIGHRPRQLPGRPDTSMGHERRPPRSLPSPTSPDYSVAMTKNEAGEVVQQAMQAKSVTFSQLASELDCPRVWLAAAVLGQHPFPAELAERLREALDLEPEVIGALRQIPTRGALDAPVPVDPTIYRLYEVIQVYGPALKALLHEEFGDGIMSAINFRADIERVADPAGDRVRITFDGKFLPYQWD